MRVSWDRPRGLTAPLRERAAIRMMHKVFGSAAKVVAEILAEESAPGASAV